MPRYKYSAVAMTGEQVQGEYAATDESGVIAMLRQSGFFPVNIAQMTGKETKVTRSKIKAKPLAGFCSQMAAMIRAGVPISKTLEILKNQTEDKTLKLILEDIYGAVQRGNSLSESLSPYEDNFPSIFLNMIEAGEASGSLDICLERAGISFSRTAKLNNKVKNAMIYPIIILIVMLGLLTLMFIYVIPAFTGLYEQNGSELPGFTLLLVDISHFVQTRWYVIVLIMAGIVFGIKFWLDSESGRTAFDRFKLRMPILHKFLLKIYAARFARTLSSLNASGVPLTQGLNVTARSVINRYMEKELYKVSDAVYRGESLSDPLERMGLLPQMITYMIRLGEESGTMDTLLNQAADYYDEESESALQALMAMLEPALILMMAAIVVPVLIAVVMPMFTMYNML